MARLSVVIPHWPIDAEVDEALRSCVVSLPADCEKLVIVTTARDSRRTSTGESALRPATSSP
jgi:hypothetical protein